jgi:hypothetical protein
MDRIWVTKAVEKLSDARINCNEKSINVIFRLVVFIHFWLYNNYCDFVSNTKNDREAMAGGKNRVLILKPLFVYTKKEMNCSKQSKRSGRAECSSAN